MRITESFLRQIIREEARSSFREGIDDDFDDEPLHPSSWRDGEGDDEEEEEREIAARPRKTVEDVINDLMDKGAENWSRVSNDFYAMSDGEDVAQAYYPGLSASDFGKIARKLDAHFNY